MSRPSGSNALSGCSAVGSSTSIRACPASAHSTAVEARSPTSGIHGLSDCLLASRTMADQRCLPFATLFPSHLTMERCAAQGMTPSTPSSVACCTAYSSRSPFASAWASQIVGLAGGDPDTVVTSRTNSAGSVDTIVPVTTSPAPFPTASDSPGARRLTVTACLASLPVTEIRSPTRADANSSFR